MHRLLTFRPKQLLTTSTKISKLIPIKKYSQNSITTSSTMTFIRAIQISDNLIKTSAIQRFCLKLAPTKSQISNRRHKIQTTVFRNTKEKLMKLLETLFHTLELKKTTYLDKTQTSKVGFILVDKELKVKDRAKLNKE